MTIRVWDATSGRELSQFQGCQDGIPVVAFAPDGATLTSGSSDGRLRVWDMNSERRLRTLAGHPNGVRCLAYFPGGQILASGGRDHLIRLWDLENGVRALEVLVRINTTEAREVVAALAQEATETAVIRAAREALERVDGAATVESLV